MRHLRHLETCFIDFEASAYLGYPIEIGWATSDGKFGSVLIRPESEWLRLGWSREAEAVHNLSRDLVDAQGVCARTAIEIFRTALTSFEDVRIVSDCWQLDSRWLKMLCVAADMDPRGILIASGDGSAHNVVREALIRDQTPTEIEAHIARSIARNHTHSASEDAAAWLAALKSAAALSVDEVNRIFESAKSAAVEAAPWRHRQNSFVLESG